jgi:hypothetical protein
VETWAGTGFLGGYTTFSTFENDALTLWERGERILMAANLVGSVAVGFVAGLMGTVLARGLEVPRSPEPRPSLVVMKKLRSQSSIDLESPKAGRTPKVPTG